MLNILMDAMILNLTIGLTRARSSKFRFWLAVLVASSIVPLSIYYSDSWMTGPIGKVILSFFIIIIAFAYSSLRSMFMQWLSFYFVTFAIGGGMLAIHFLLTTNMKIESGSLVTYSGGFGDPVSWGFVLVGFPCSYAFTKWRLSQISIHKMKLDQIYEVTVEWLGRSHISHGLVDSGNQLVDPVSRKLVFLADEHVMTHFLSKDVLNSLTIDAVTNGMDEIPDEVQSSLRLVPYQAAGTSGQLLVTVMVDSITVKTAEGPLTMRNPLLGIQQHDLTHDGSYHLLIHPHVMVKGQTA